MSATTKERVCRIRREYPCLTLQYIANKCGVSREYVRQILDAAGLKTIADKTRQYQYYHPLVACHTCGKLFNVRDIRFILKWERNFCSPACNGKSKRRHDIDDIIAMYISGESYKSIGVKHGMSAQQVGHIVSMNRKKFKLEYRQRCRKL